MYMHKCYSPPLKSRAYIVGICNSRRTEKKQMEIRRHRQSIDKFDRENNNNVTTSQFGFKKYINNLRSHFSHLHLYFFVCLSSRTLHMRRVHESQALQGCVSLSLSIRYALNTNCIWRTVLRRLPRRRCCSTIRRRGLWHAARSSFSTLASPPVKRRTKSW